MGETFYTILGVDRDADAGAIRRAYRSRVKECHPDVSDDPDAGEQFQRLTTARDVLLDADERATYDRLGHDAYVHSHVEASVWGEGAAEPPDRATGGRTASAGSASASGQADSGVSSGEKSADATHRRATGATDQHRSTARQRTHTTETGGDPSGRGNQWHNRQRRPDGGAVEEDWQRAPDAYRRTASTGRSRRSTGSTVEAIGQIGPWLFIHLTLVVSALLTTGFMLGRPGTDPAIAAATGLFSLLLVGVVGLLSAIHILTELS